MGSCVKFIVSIAAVCALFACAPVAPSIPSVSSSHVHSMQRPPPKKTACVSFQGNGVYFASHVGALIALLENNFEPVFASGGSSGAILASVSRALVENSSLSVGGEFNPQQAARLLAASAPVIESVLFLPRFTHPLNLLDSLDVFLTGSSVGVLRADPTDGLANAESIVGQSTLVIDFYRSVDFSRVLSKVSLADRESEVARLWKTFANSVDVTSEQMADALLVDRDTLLNEGRLDLVEIQDRVFKLYRSKKDSFHRNYKTQQDSWNQLIAANGKLFGLASKEKRQALFRQILTKTKTLESFDALAATLSGQFMLADPDRVYRAFEGFDSRSNRRIEIPSNTIIHSTARRAKRVDGEWKEQKGIESLHQVYFTPPQLASHAASRLEKPENNPLKPRRGDLQPVIPSERIVVTAQLLGPSLAATTGEPTAFLRFPVDLDVPSRLRLGWTNVHETLVGYGGWLEKVSLGTSRQFDVCSPQSVDAYFYTSDGDGVNRFAKMAFLGLFLDTPMRGLLARQIENPVDIRALLAGNGTNNLTSRDAASTEFNAAVGSADSVFADNRGARALVGHMPVNFNYVNPSESSGSSKDQANIALRSNRRAMLLASYEFTQRVLAEQKLKRASVPLWNVTSDQIKVLTLTRPDEIQSLVDKVFPRLTY